jgi:hypothetical protein
VVPVRTERPGASGRSRSGSCLSSRAWGGSSWSYVVVKWPVIFILEGVLFRVPGRAAGLVFGGGQAAPGRALAQEPAQRGHPRIVSVGGWPRPRPDRRAQASIIMAMKCKSLKSNAAVPVWQPQHKTGHQANSTVCGCRNRLLVVRPVNELTFGILAISRGCGALAYVAALR